MVQAADRDIARKPPLNVIRVYPTGKRPRGRHGIWKGSFIPSSLAMLQDLKEELVDVAVEKDVSI